MGNKHGKACKAYKEWFVDEYSYGFCEVCSRSNQPMDTHHLYSAGLYPKHKELHNFRNLILLCRDCHSKFHANALPEVFHRIENERGLKKLFNVV